MATSLESTQQALTLARRAIESGRDAAVIPKAYLNFDVALAIVDGCRSAIGMADARDPKTLIPKLEAASTSFALLEVGIAESSVKAARAYVDRAVMALRASGALEQASRHWGAFMSEAKIKIGEQVLTPEQSELIRIAVDRLSYDERVDAGSRDRARVLELKVLIDKECGKG